MEIKQIRSATSIIQFAGKKILLDPWLGKKGSSQPFPYTLNQDRNNPITELPMSVDEIIKDIDAVIVTHLHHDHFDEVARDVLPKSIKIFTQSEENADELKSAGFNDVEVLKETGTSYGEIKLTKTKAQHGIGEIMDFYYAKLGVSGSKEVMGVILTHPKEKTLYIAGDTVWCEEVKEAIEKFSPEIIIINVGDARFIEGGPMIMATSDVYETCKAAPKAKLIAHHLDSVNPATLSRKDLKVFLEVRGLTSNVLVPDDGESYTF